MVKNTSPSKAPHTKVLITGAFGNIGSLVIRELLAQGYTVKAFDVPTAINKSNAKKFSQDPIETCWGDITKQIDVQNAIHGVDAVIHLAGIFPPTSENNKALAKAVNIDGTRHLIEAMEQSAQAKRLVFASSIAVYGQEQGKVSPPLSPEGPINPTDYYGETKAEGEQMIRQSALQWSLLRISASPPVNIKNMGSFIGNSILNLHPDSHIEPVHPADAALAFVNALGNDESIGKTFLLGGGSHCQITLHEQFSCMLKTFGLKPMPRETFNLNDGIVFHGDWLDTTESQRILKFQRHDHNQLHEDLKNSFGPLKHLFILAKLLSPLIYRVMLWTSPYYKINCRQHR